MQARPGSAHPWLVSLRLSRAWEMRVGTLVILAMAQLLLVMGCWKPVFKLELHYAPPPPGAVLEFTDEEIEGV